MSFRESTKATTAGPSSHAGLREDSGGLCGAWDKLNVLTFDGGGVKGYYSLLQLQKLMEYIGEREKELEIDSPLRHRNSRRLNSFSPCEEPMNVSHLGGWTPFLPCHYFDYIAGTSTGALITIMLARLRMPVEDCLAEYKQFGGNVFGRPRTFHQVGKRGYIFSKTKFRTTYLEDAIKDVIRRRGEVCNDHDDALPFTTPKGLCRALVLVEIDNRVATTKDKIFLFRSYDHFHSRSGDKTHVSITGDTSGKEIEKGPRNPGSGTRFAAWKVARAATAAKLFFEPLVVVKGDGEIVRKNTRSTTNRRPTLGKEPKTSSWRTTTGLQMPTLHGLNGYKPRESICLTDAGYGRANNPSELVLSELRHLLANRNKKIDTWVSVGTARSLKDNHPEEKRLHITTSRVVLEGLNKLGDTEPVHEHMRDESSKDKGEGFNYVRLNEPGALDIEMDEWKISGEDNVTLGAIRDAFNNWAAKPENVKMFQRYALILVQNRRERAKNRSRWDRFALGNFYVCGEKNCAYDCDKTWDYREEFENHLMTHDKNASKETLAKMMEDCEQHWDYKPPPRAGGTLAG